MGEKTEERVGDKLGDKSGDTGQECEIQRKQNKDFCYTVIVLSYLIA